MKLLYILTFSIIIAFTGKSLISKNRIQKEITPAQPVQAPKAKDELKATMKQLWDDHVFLTRDYIISAVSDLGNTLKISEKLLKNQDDIGNAVKPYYGVETGNKLAALLRDHILEVAEIISASKLNNSEKLVVEQKKWHANADDISAFLAAINPNWKMSELKDMLYSYLAVLTDEVSARMQKNWAANNDASDKGLIQMRLFSDELTRGIIQQFPDKF